MTEIAILFAEIETRDGHSGIGFSYSVPTLPGIGVSMSEQARAWTAQQAELGKRP